MEFLWEGLMQITWQQAVMYLVGILLIYLAIKKDYEPALLLPMGFGAILVNLPLSGVLNQTMEGIGSESSLPSAWRFFWALICGTRPPSALSGQQTDRPPFWYRRFSAPATSAPSLWQLIPIWPWFPLYSPLLSVW